MNWLPDRKILVGGLASLLAWVLVLCAAKLGFVLPLEQATALVAAVYGIVAYLVPPSVADVVKRVDETIIRLAGEQRS